MVAVVVVVVSVVVVVLMGAPNRSCLVVEAKSAPKPRKNEGRGRAHRDCFAMSAQSRLLVDNFVVT